MSMRIFLKSCHLDRMPNGSKNEWKDFFLINQYGLDANAFFPLFWLLLYNQEHIQFARYIDDYDINNKDAEIERQECLDDFGDTTYPYFIVSKEIALKNLNERKQAFLECVGLTFKKDYEEFEQIITEKYHHYILIITNGLDLNNQSEQNFKELLIHYENLSKAQNIMGSLYWQTIKKEIKFSKNISYYLMGECFDYSQKNWTYEKTDTAYPLISNLNSKIIPNYIYWILAIINGLFTLGVFLKTQSILYGFISFIICSVIISIAAVYYEK